MSFVEVFEILGQPKSSAFQGGEWIVKYSLHEYWKGWVPYYVVFDKETKQVTHWFADEAEYQQNQQQWMMLLQAMEETENTYNSRQGGGDGGGGDAIYMGDYGTTDAGSYESYDTFEADSAGWPGGAYQNPSSSYYEPAVYE